MEYKADKNAQEKILVARMLAEKNQKEDKECRSFDYYLIDELKQQIYDGEREHEDTREELDNLKRIVQLHEEEEAQRRQELRKLHTEVTMELLLGLKSVLEDAKKTRDKVKEIPQDDAEATVGKMGLMAVYADHVIKVGQALEKLMVY
jgi:hypothetical protein